MRRVQRRMQARRCAAIEDYVAYLRENPDEATLLFRDLLINVTSFFRDEEAFAALEQTVIPRLFEKKGAADWVRVWSPGCATGEEAVSIAILMREHMSKLRVAPRVTIFATEVDEAALNAARAGRYPEAMMEGVSWERRQRFFTPDTGGYIVAKEVRDLCVFSAHDILRDPPFSRINLISCRNLLIYFNARAQAQMFPVFHYALRTGGFLFLGMSYSLAASPIYSRRSTSSMVCSRPATPGCRRACRSSPMDGVRLRSEFISLGRTTPGPALSYANRSRRAFWINSRRRMSW